MSSGDSRRSSVKQVASGRFGVTTNYLVNADELPGFDLALFRDGQLAQRKSLPPAKGSRFWLESFRVSEPTVVSQLGRTGTTRQQVVIRTVSLVAQSNFLNDRVVTTLGWRRDRRDGRAWPRGRGVWRW